MGEGAPRYRRELQAAVRRLAGEGTTVVTYRSTDAEGNVQYVNGKFTASFFCSTDEASNQIASFYTGAMANAAELD